MSHWDTTESSILDREILKVNVKETCMYALQRGATDSATFSLFREILWRLSDHISCLDLGSFLFSSLYGKAVTQVNLKNAQNIFYTHLFICLSGWAISFVSLLDGVVWFGSVISRNGKCRMTGSHVALLQRNIHVVFFHFSVTHEIVSRPQISWPSPSCVCVQRFGWKWRLLRVTQDGYQRRWTKQVDWRWIRDESDWKNGYHFNSLYEYAGGEHRDWNSSSILVSFQFHDGER